MAKEISASLPELFGPQMLNDPYPVYRVLRSEAPVYWHEPFGAWLLSSYDDVVEVAKDSRFSNKRTASMHAMSGSEKYAEFFDFVSDRMVFTDPPRHTRLRGLVNRSFTARAIEKLPDYIQSLIDGFIDEVIAGGRMDIVSQLAFPLPSSVIGKMLGLPDGDWARLKKWSDDFTVFVSSHPANIPEEAYDRAARSLDEMLAYFREVLESNEADEESVLGQMRAARRAGNLSDAELLANANMLLVAGHETTTNLIGNGMLALLRDPAALRRLRVEPALISPAIEEFLRCESPVQFTHRVAVEDVRIRDRTIRKGDFVYLLIGAANRDPAQFSDPDALQLLREPNRHIAFGVGTHFCLGSTLARMEARMAIGTILRRMPNIQLDTERVAYHANFNLRGLVSLPVAFA